jgi:phosphonate transport system permease protein
MSLTVGDIFQRQSEMERRRRLYTMVFIILGLAVFVSGYSVAEDMNSGSFFNGLSQFFDYPGEIVVESFQSDKWLTLFIGFIPSMIETINIAAVGTLFGVLGAVVLSFCASANLGVFPWIIPFARRLMDVTRAFPELILALFLIYVLGQSPVPALIAVAFHTAGALGKLFSEVNENIDRKPLEGLQATGATWLQRMRFGVVPQVLPNYFSYVLLRFEINIRASAILGFVGAGGIGQDLRTAISWGDGAMTSAIFVLLFISIMVIDQISGRLRRNLVGGTFQMA